MQLKFIKKKLKKKSTLEFVIVTAQFLKSKWNLKLQVTLEMLKNE